MAPSLFNKLVKKVKKTKPKKRTYHQDASLVATLKKVARQQGRSPKAIVDEMAKWHEQDQLRQEKVRALWRKMASREQEVTALACLGYDRNQMAEILSVSPETIKTHLDNIFRKLNVRTTKHVVAIFQGWDFAKWWDETPH